MDPQAVDLLLDIPERVSWLKIWMDGALFPCFPEDRENNLATLTDKFTIGDFTRASEPYHSSQIIGDLTGGALARRVNGTTAQRYLDGLGDFSYPNLITLGPMIDSFASPVALSPGQTFMPIGVAGLNFYGCFGLELCIFNDLLNGNGSYTSVGTLATPPVNPATMFKGKLYIPTDDGYYSWDGSTLSAKITTVLARDFATMPSEPNQMWVLTSDGKVGFTTDGVAWTMPAGLQFFDETPREITEYVNTSGDPALIFNTDHALWYVDPVTPALRRTRAYWPRHPDFGKGMAMWPSGQDLYVAQGMGMLRWDGETAIPGPGLDKDAGVPARFRGFIAAMLATYNDLYVLVSGQSTATETMDTYFSEPRMRELSPVVAERVAYATLWKYTGNGWHRVWETNTPTIPTKLSLNTANGAYRVVWGGGATAYHMDIRLGAYNPQDGLQIGLDRFAPFSFFELGRFYADAEGLQKLSSYLMNDVLAATATEDVRIYFELEDHPGWNLLGILSAAGRLPLRFNVDPTFSFSRGHLSEWSRLRVELRRQAVTTETGAEKLAIERKSPLLDSIVHKFLILPEPTTSHTITIPIPNEPFCGRGPNTIRNHIDRLAAPSEFFPVVIGRRLYRGKISQLTGSNLVGSRVQGIRQVTLLDFPDGVEHDTEGLIDFAASVIEGTPP